MADLKYELKFSCPVDFIESVRSVMERGGIYNIRRYIGAYADSSLGHQILSGVYDAPNGYSQGKMLDIASDILDEARTSTGQRRIGVLFGIFPIEEDKSVPIDTVRYQPPKSCY